MCIRDSYWTLRDRMIEATRIFTSFTNKWKDENLQEGNKLLAQTKVASESEIKKIIENLPSNSKTKVRGSAVGIKFVPSLPSPKEEGLRTVSYKKSRAEIELLGDYLFDNADAEPRDVGARTFDIALENAKQ